MDRVLSCECGREHSVSSSQAGQEIHCRCGKILPVPTLRGMRQLPLADSPAQSLEQSANGGDKSVREWQGWRGMGLAVSMACFLIAASFCGWYALQRSRIDTSFTVQQEVQAGDAMIDSFDPATLSEMWHSFGQMGMQLKRYPDFYLYQLYAADLTQNALIAGAIAAGCALIGLGIWLTTPKLRTQG